MKLSFWLVLSVLALVSLACAPSVLFAATPEMLPRQQPTAAPIPAENLPATALPPTAFPTAMSAPTKASVPPITSVLDLTNTSWTGMYDNDPNRYFNPTFLPGGILRYTVPSGTWENGTWIQQGSTVIIETNNHYADMTGVINGTEITGTAHNTAGKSWNWRVNLVSAGSSSANSLDNTRWLGSDSDGDQISWYLMPNGIVEYANPDTYYRNGTWTLDGNSFHIETNNHYADYTGTLSGDTLSGSAKNVKNSTWTWSLQKVETCVNFCGQTWANLYNTAWISMSGSYLRLYFKGSELAFQTELGGVDHSGSYQQDKDKLTLDLSPIYSNCSAQMVGDSIFLTCGSTSWTLQQIKAW